MGRPVEADDLPGAVPEHDLPSIARRTALKPTSTLDDIKQGAGNLAAGAVRGAGSIGATILWPWDKAQDIIHGDREQNLSGLVTGKQPLSRNEERRQAMDEGLRTMGAEPDSILYKTGKLTGEIAGTAGAGGVLANGARAVPALAKFAPVIQSGGFNLGQAATKSKLVNALLRMGGGAAQGGTQAAMVNPEDAGTGALVGGVIPGVAQVAGYGGRTLKALTQPFYDKGQNQIIGNLLRNAAAGNADDVASRMLNAKPLVPGSNPTAGQVSNNAGIAALERTAEAIDPTAYAANRTAQAQARNVALEGLKGTDDAYSAAVTARNKATSPLYAQVAKSDALADPGRTVNLIDKIVSANPKREALVNALKTVRNTMFDEYPLTQRGADGWKVINDNLGGKGISGPDFDALKLARTVMDRVKKGAIDDATALEQLKGIKASGQRASEAIELAKSHIKTPDYVVTQSPQALQSASKNIGDMINAKGPNGSRVNEAIVRELSIIKKSLDNQIGKAEPAYKAAQQTFAAESGPINQMDVARKIADKAVNPVTENINPVQFAKAISDKTAAQAIGFKRAKIDQVMTPEQLGTLNNIKEDLARQVFRDTAGRGVGSDTVQKLAYSNLIDAGGVPTFLRNMALGQTVGNIAGRGADALYGRANKELANKLAQALLNPQDAGNAMLLAAPKNKAIVNSFLGNNGLLGAPSVMATNP